MTRAWWLILAAAWGCGSTPLEADPDATTSGTSGTTGTTSGESSGVVPTSGDVPGTGSASGSESGESGESSESGESGESSGTTGEDGVGPRYNEVRQKSAHNSFQRDEAIVDMIAVHRVRSLEFDVHVGKTLEDDVAGDWYVYHTDIVDDDSQCRTLSVCLGVVASAATVLPEHEVVTLWVDLKDGFADGHRPADLDALIEAAFGERLLTPGGLVAGCPGATSVQGAVVACGWPLLMEMRGRVMVALTGGGAELGEYVGGDANGRAAFVAPALAGDFVGHPEAAIINLEAGDVAVATAARAAGLVSRVWVLDDSGAWDAAVAAGAHHLASNKVNAWQDAWATTTSAGGWPFTCIDACDMPDRELGAVLRVDVDSGDLWNDSDDAVFVHWPVADGAVAVTGLLGAVSSHVEPFIKGCVGGRVGVAADAAYLAVCRPADDEPPRVQVRAAAGEETEEFLMDGVDGLAAELPAFAKFERSADGECAVGYGSADGVGWSKIAERCFDAAISHVGVMASANDAGAAQVRMFGLTATPGGSLLAADAATELLGGAAGGAGDDW